MVGLGLVARRIEPGALSLPEPSGRRRKLSEVRSGQDAAKAARDEIAGFIPRNLTRSMGRTLVLMGAKSWRCEKILDGLVSTTRTWTTDPTP